MRIISAYLMAMLGGKDAPTKADIVAILSAIGSDVAALDADIDRLLASVGMLFFHYLLRPISFC